eukprot:4717414-Pyramimonas_sp.AAC.1
MTVQVDKEGVDFITPPRLRAALLAGHRRLLVQTSLRQGSGAVAIHTLRHLIPICGWTRLIDYKST